MYADASNEGQGGARALLYSPTLTQETVGACSKIQFWFVKLTVNWINQYI